MNRTRIAAAIAAAAAALALAGCGAAAASGGGASPAAPGPSHSAAASPFKDPNGYRCQSSEITILDGFSYCPADPAATPASPPAAPAVTASQQQALDSAQSYLSDGQGFSRAGLISQLSSPSGEQFSVADATYAADHSGADWNAQAVISAKNYMSDGQGFSRSGLIDQLTSASGEQFTLAQATYAAGQAGL